VPDVASAAPAVRAEVIDGDGVGGDTDHPRRRTGMNFNSILIGSENPETLVEYYTKLLGEPGFADSGYSGWQIGSGYLTVGPHSEVHGRNPSPGRFIWNIETPDVKEVFERFKAAGALVVREPYEFEGMPGSSIATLEDPDGNYFQLTSPMEMPPA
jgi:predicted enzyme related to lactoylglutathione lyase